VAPRCRVVSVHPRPGIPYQTGVTDLVGVVRQFGFEHPVVLGEGAGCVTAVLLAAWYPEHAGGLILVRAALQLVGESIEARALRACPPDWTALRAAVRCPMIEAGSAEEVVATLP
jgi:pimeloyl-ACP methyl ester carboxylesterase